MNVLVTGAAGFVGSHVMRALLDHGHSVVAAVRPTTPRDRLQPFLDRVRVLDIDLESTAGVDAMLAAAQPDAVIHAAWYADPTDYRSSPRNRDSLAMTIRVAEGVVRAGIPRLVGLGSCLEYAPSDKPLRETDPLEPNTLYGECKRDAWIAMEAAAAGTQTRVAWARIFHVYGPGEDPRRLLPSVARRLRAGEPIDLSPGEQVRDQIHVADVADALVLLAGSEYEGPINLCSGVPVTLKEVLTRLADVFGRRELLRFDARPYLKDEAMYLIGAPDQRNLISWTPRHDLRLSYVLAEPLHRPA
jgi:dTDP-6-deoxy-L-talose 4-dehydrogenase (NAD+)